MPKLTTPKVIKEDSSKSLSDVTLVRLPEILAPGGPLPISRSSFLAKVRSGQFPKAIKLGPRTSAWSKKSIIALIERFESGELDGDNLDDVHQVEAFK